MHPQSTAEPLRTPLAIGGLRPASSWLSPGRGEVLDRPRASTVQLTLFAPERWPRARGTGYRHPRMCTERPPPEASHKVRIPPRQPLPAALYTCPGACRGCTLTSPAGASPPSPRTPQKVRTPAEPQATVGEPQSQLHNEASAFLWKHEAPHSDRPPLLGASSPSTALRRARRRLRLRSCAEKGSTLQRIPYRFLLAGEVVDPLPQLHGAV